MIRDAAVGQLITDDPWQGKMRKKGEVSACFRDILRILPWEIDEEIPFATNPLFHTGDEGLHNVDQADPLVHFLQ